ncbi:SigB/SigF/SigG family RNA polymerase sigma factor [Tepidibacter formicigenes]|jgi:RNA polymerase sigma-B factor|uniref:RNA polymerase sigma-B factor n=1 Tax=Tepidibacter formicigenes DSM 15518 TaxID=1123349 RepID=A0A1M6P710_9FIRM|nr:SigB/SigF/SigG family RNA polymerase sigma factor [Tepidibacter formicigenes]SHK03734.1 RNA polymerase sigma-B factor [Tepidibacter formicigenes DSM 15518]
MKNVAKATSNIDEALTEKELFALYKNTKDISIRNILVERYMYIVDILSKKFINKGIEYEDIYQVASLGLIYAIDRFDIERGYEFSSFATPTIVGEIKKYFRDKGWSIRVPRRIQELSKKVNKTRLELEQKNQKPPKIEDIANYLGCSQEDVLEAMEASQGYKTTSLDISYDNDRDDKDIRLMDLMGNEDKNFKKIENKDFINNFINKLNEIEVKIVKDRFFNEKTQSNIAKELGVSQMTISRLEKKIISKLQKEYEKII